MSNTKKNSTNTLTSCIPACHILTPLTGHSCTGVMECSASIFQPTSRATQPNENLNISLSTCTYCVNFKGDKSLWHAELQLQVNYSNALHDN